MYALVMFAALVFAVVPVTPPGFDQAREPQLAIDGDKSVYAVYGMGGAVYVSASRDRGESFAAPVKVGEREKPALGMRRGPRIAVHDGVLTVTTISHADGDLVAYRSDDRGRHWGAQVHVNDVSGSAREGLHAMAAAPNGTLACAWLDGRTKGTKIYAATSGDGGASWSANRLVYASPSGSVCECCHPSLAFAGNGRLIAMFRNSLGGARDMYTCTSSDLGATWGPATKLGTGTWPLNACPMDGGCFAMQPEGGIAAVWRRENTLFVSGAGGAERRFAEGRQPWIALGSDGPYVAWTEGRRILASTPRGKGIELASEGDDAAVAASPDGRLVIAAWTARGIEAARLSQ